MALTDAGRRRPDAVRLAERALTDPRCERDPRCLYDALTTLALAGEPAADAANRLTVPDSILPILFRARAARFEGDLDTAWSLYEPLHRTVTDPRLRPVVVAETVELLLDRGDPAGAGAALAGHGGAEAELAPELLCARGAVAMAGGEFVTALADHLACGRALRLGGVVNPARSAWRRRAASCAHRTGQARLAADLAEQEHEAALAWGEPRTIGLALATLAVAGGSREQIDLLDESAELLEAAGAAVEAGDIRHEVGSRLWRDGRLAFARAQFNQAIARFQGAGNGHRAARTEAALARLRTRPEPALTRNETRVAFLALVGYSNRDIAAKLFLAVRTVEFHLSQVYRKLGIRCRDELWTGMLDTGTVVKPPGVPYVPGGVAVAQAAGAASPERVRALRAVALANHGHDRAAVVQDAALVLGSDSRGDLLAFWCAVLALVHAGATDLAAYHCERQNGQHGEFVTALRARLAWLRGDPGTAADLLRGLLDDGRSPLRELLVAWSIAAAVDLGDLDHAHGLALDHLSDPDPPGPGDKPELLAALGDLALATDHQDLARAAFLECGHLLTAACVHNPAVSAWRSRASLCADASGRRRLAAVLAERELALARRWGDRRTIGVAAHAHAVVVARTPEEIAKAADLLADYPADALLRARYDLAQFLSSGHRYPEARTVLRAVGELAAKGGYQRWSSRAVAALRRLSQQAGIRLTAQERKIAELARAGLSNRRIAESQNLTLRTIEFHLSSVYRKLGISGRRDLAALRTPLM
ncbi:helix-turn-helix domain-containing protein [Amycolatopsis suaedae]|uniref:LuxR family transcriptional regulator n=1 Tax=Amycolatopsis suaedae TaxID=2510978 RepID=A0A4Q7J8A5_9PSEU|nr:helix-turn-helix transcriptional regulator [Amycolatopsis suaedae]RZQ63921.1 LuxR family transcriptional regulator [Amycolatopsis suaedae]